MTKKLVTDIVINLAGNMAAKARQYGQSMSQFAAQSKSALAMMNSTMAATSQGIDTFGNRLVLAGGAAAIAFERTFVKTAAEFERYQIMLDKLQGGPEGGAKAMDWIKQFTQETPYAVNEVTNSFVKLKAFGLDPMDGTMQAIADQASMMGGTAETLDGIALALGQAWTKGKLQGEEALQLLERGVPVWDYLAKASKELGKNNGLGYTTQQLQEMASKGQLTRKAIKDLIDQMAKASQGAAKNQMNSWNGMISNMGDSWTLFKTDVMDSGAFEVLKKELGGLLNQLDEMKKSGEYDAMVEQIGGDLVDAFHAAAEAIRDAKDLGTELIPVLKAVGDTANGIADMVGGYENLAKILGSIYLLNKGASFLAPVAKGGVAVGKGIYTAGSWAAGALSGKGKGGKSGGIGGAMSDLGAMPVYVVNMPGGGFDIPTGGPDSPKSKFPKTIQAAKNLAPFLLRAGVPFTALYAASQAPEAQRLKAESDAAQVERATNPQQPMLSNQDAFALMAKKMQQQPVTFASVATPAVNTPEKPAHENAYAQMAKKMQQQPVEPSKPSLGIDGNPVFALSLNSADIAGGMANILADLGSMLSPTPLQPQKVETALDITMHYDRPPTVRTRDTAPGMQVRVDTGPSLMP
ncbi:tape measure protein [Aeromonas enteropelogenes]|uniref:tape measure protein n=1 Tax=Aeromonas enteropelogenes TaxID=29489 RepID=UPI003BA14E22